MVGDVGRVWGGSGAQEIKTQHRYPLRGDYINIEMERLANRRALKRRGPCRGLAGVGKIWGGKRNRPTKLLMACHESIRATMVVPEI